MQAPLLFNYFDKAPISFKFFVCMCANILDKFCFYLKFYFLHFWMICGYYICNVYFNIIIFFVKEYPNLNMTQWLYNGFSIFGEVEYHCKLFKRDAKKLFVWIYFHFLWRNECVNKWNRTILNIVITFIE